MGVAALVGLVGATWCYFDRYFDPDEDFFVDDKRQRKFVRRFLVIFLAAPVWPLGLVAAVVWLLVKLIAFAFPRESEE
jgi:hypothetical protein